MNIGVCFKSTPETTARIKVAGDGNHIDTAQIKWIISPYDEFAIEEAVQTKEKLGGEVVLFTVGGSKSTKNIREGLAVGGDRAVQIDDAALGNTDSLGVARALAAAVAAEDTQLLFTGKQAIDDQASEVPGMVAALLGWPHISCVNDFSTDGTTFTATRVLGGGVEEVVSGPLPVVITAERGLNSPRYAKLPAILKAKRKPLAKKDLGALGLDGDKVAAAVSVSGMDYPPERPKGRIIDGDAEDAASELVRLLREEAKVI